MFPELERDGNELFLPTIEVDGELGVRPYCRKSKSVPDMRQIPQHFRVRNAIAAHRQLALRSNVGGYHYGLTNGRSALLRLQHRGLTDIFPGDTLIASDLDRYALRRLSLSWHS